MGRTMNKWQNRIDAIPGGPVGKKRRPQHSKLRRVDRQSAEHRKTSPARRHREQQNAQNATPCCSQQLPTSCDTPKRREGSIQGWDNT